MEQWYCLYTKPNSEYLVGSSLEWCGYKTYLPLVACSSVSNDKKPFFPCYLFLQANFETISLSSIQWIPGLRHIISFNNKPVSLSDELIANIQSLVEQFKGYGGLSYHHFNQGDPVRIINGPLYGLEAIFDEPENANRRVHVLLKFLGQLNRVAIGVEDLEKTTEVSVNQAKLLRRTRGKGRRINAV